MKELTSKQLYQAVNEFYDAVCGTIGFDDNYQLDIIGKQFGITAEDFEDYEKFWDEVCHQMFTCDVCGWWCEAWEESEEELGMCEECYEEENPPEEDD